jgi:hypothetical protein
MAADSCVLVAPLTTYATIMDGHQSKQSRRAKVAAHRLAPLLSYRHCLFFGWATPRLACQYQLHTLATAAQLYCCGCGWYSGGAVGSTTSSAVTLSEEPSFSAISTSRRAASVGDRPSPPDPGRRM